MTINITLINPLIQYGVQSYSMLCLDNEGLLPDERLEVNFNDSLNEQELEDQAINLAQEFYNSLV